MPEIKLRSGGRLIVLSPDGPNDLASISADRDGTSQTVYLCAHEFALLSKFFYEKTDAIENERAAFEAWITSPPYEHGCDRNAWPGQYKRHETQLAWESWIAAKGLCCD